MTRSHFEALAAITARITDYPTRERVAEEQAAYFAEVNPHFDTEKYLKACGAVA